jgi:hypothetical protein
MFVSRHALRLALTLITLGLVTPGCDTLFGSSSSSSEKKSASDDDDDGAAKAKKKKKKERDGEEASDDVTEPAVALPEGEVGFFASYARSSDPDFNQLRQAFVEQRFFEQIAEALNETLVMREKVDIVFQDCNMVNAMYSPSEKKITMCYELVGFFVQSFMRMGQPQAQALESALGATLFTFFHELGHALIDIKKLPVTGREEDAVDQLSTLILLEGGSEGAEMAFSGARAMAALGAQSNMPFWDEHSFGEQRFYNVACLILGSNPGKYIMLASEGFIPTGRAVQCQDEYQKGSGAWQQIMAPHLRGEGFSGGDK